MKELNSQLEIITEMCSVDSVRVDVVGEEGGGDAISGRGFRRNDACNSRTTTGRNLTRAEGNKTSKLFRCYCVGSVGFRSLATSCLPQPRPCVA